MRAGIRRITGIFLMVAMILSAGCGQKEQDISESVDTAGGSTADGSEAAVGMDGGEKAMGRYVETAISGMEASHFRRADIVEMEDGSLVCFDMKNGKYISKDNGETWEAEQVAWLDEMSLSGYLMDVAFSADGYAGVIYSPSGEADETEAAKADETEADKTEADKTEAAADAGGTDGEELATDVDYNLYPEYLIIAPDGTQKEVEIPYQENSYVEDFCFSEEGRLFGAALDGKIYEINREDGSISVITELSGWVFHIAVSGNRMICTNNEGITVLDLDTKEVLSDEVLDDFIKTTFGSTIEHYSSSPLPLVTILDGEDIMYLICNQGIFRHAIGGNMMEQIVDGTLTSLNNPAYGIVAGTLCANDSFLVLFTGGRLIRYTYDPNMPAVPEVQLKAYSLTENLVLKQVISRYQAQHPEVYIKYEVGMDAASSVTREDALKKLNTEIVAGTGPDLFVLDDMPIDSYIDKEILLELTPYLEDISQEEELFTNILNAFTTPKGIYAVPVQFTLPLVAGKKSELEQLTDLKAIADIMEKTRLSQPEGNIIGAMGEEALLNKLLPVCAPAWITESGEADAKALTEFLMQAKRIWDAEKVGITPMVKETYEQYVSEMSGTGMSEDDIREYLFSLNGQTLDYVSGKQNLIVGSVEGSFDFSTVISAFRVKGKTDSNFAVCNGQASEVFVPKTIIGISSQTANADRAGELLKTLLGEAEGADWNAFPVNEKLWDKMMTNPNPGEESFGSMMVSDENGEVLSLDIYWPSDEEIASLKQISESARTPYMHNAVLEDSVCQIGVKILSGEKSVEDGTAEIMKKAAIYMAE